MRGDALDRVRLLVFSTPAMIAAYSVLQSRVTRGAFPGFRRNALLAPLVGLCRFLLVPLAGTVSVKDGPAQITGPDLSCPSNIFSADYALVLAVVDVFVNPRRKIGGCALVCLPGRSPGT